ncbi:hypothetical protein L1987_22451 [Smallanthus sonchifolius]|uniref:Uncharacterized protein n=1 Tax=Smallanthus sonchifolius TaxID=185202 RepID=A0ACB9IE58_9ASTR|nr:hypothetical protein L1987_22451 [Smallanthus sonchifolius]
MVMLTLRLMRLERGDDNQLPPLVVVESPQVAVEQSHSTHRSIETLVVVLAVITIVVVIAGFIARLCGGRHYGGNGEVEGWIESRCRSCIDAGVSSAPPPPPPPVAAEAAPPPKEEAKPAKEEAKK